MPAIEQALQHHRAGRLQQAEALYRQILATAPNHADALHMMGVLSAQTGKHEAAAGLIERAVQVKPNVPDYHNNLGETLRALGKFERAISAYQQALALRPTYVAARFNLGLTLQAQGRLTEAIAAYRQALALEPNAAEIYNNLGIALQEQGDLDDAVAAFGQARALKPKLAETHYNLGNARQAQGKHAEAIAAYREAIKLKPDFAEAHNNFGSVLKEQGKLTEAIACCQQALTLKPDFAEAHNNLANMLKEQGRLAEAISAYQAAIRYKPDYANAYFNLADLLLDQGELQVAIECYRQVLRLLPENAEAWSRLGAALRLHQRLAEAIEAFRTALQIKPDYPDAHNNLGLVHAALGDLEAATACYRKAIELDPDYAPAYENLAKSRRYGPADGDEIAHLQALVDSPELSESAQVSLHFALGKMLDDCGMFDEAFGHYRTANCLNHKTKNFCRERCIARASENVKTFTSHFFEQCQISGHPSELPVFIVGMPRSGTTLVEQIIASHPQVFGADELPHIEVIAATLPGRLQTDHPYPQCATLIDPPLARSLADSYLEKLRAIGGDAERVSDKMPRNFFYLGLIALMFPRARIIHCRRDPMDVCLSIYFRRFAYGHGYAYDLTDIAVHYRQYQRLMQHWHEVLPLEICDVQYEELVANQASESRRLIDYCGLPWDDRCLEYYENDRPVQSMSNWQVRQPIYTDSIQRWKHYEKHLDELKEMLAEAD